MLACALLAASLDPAFAEPCPVPADWSKLPPEAIPGPVNDPIWWDHFQKLDKQLAQTDFSAVKLLFVGDSITESWAPPVFQHFYGSRAALNIGVHGDTTQGALWRLARLPLGTTLKPKLVVVLIGTNNLWTGGDPHQLGIGVAEVVRWIRQKSPTSQVLLVGLLPRGAEPTDPLRLLAARVNDAIRSCPQVDSMVTYAEPGTLLPEGNGELSSQIVGDYLHPTWIGYAILSAALEPYIRRILADR